MRPANCYDIVPCEFQSIFHPIGLIFQALFCDVALSFNRLCFIFNCLIFIDSAFSFSCLIFNDSLLHL